MVRFSPGFRISIKVVFWEGSLVGIENLRVTQNYFYVICIVFELRFYIYLENKITLKIPVEILAHLGNSSDT